MPAVAGQPGALQGMVAVSNGISLAGAERASFDLAGVQPSAAGAVARKIEQLPVTVAREVLRSGAPFHEGEVVYIDGPTWIVQVGRHGPSVEFAALGGGDVASPPLAHVHVEWHF